jgi:ribonuclease HI
MKKTPKIFFDASLKKDSVGIGIHDFLSNKEISLSKPISTKSSTEAENLAFQEAISFALSTYSVSEIHFFTDNKNLFDSFKSKVINSTKINLFWIPRELNSIADKLSKANPHLKAHKEPLKDKSIINHTKGNATKKTLIRENLSSYLVNKYSFEKRFLLLKKLYPSKRYSKFINNLKSTNPKNNIPLDSSLVEFYSVVNSLLSNREKPKIIKQCYSFKGFKSQIDNKTLELKLKSIF